MGTSIIDAAKVIRSKNAGPYELTMDIIFKDKSYFNTFKNENIITDKKISELYQIPVDNVLKIIYFEPSNAIKITIKRWDVSGAPGEKDIYGAQQHAPLFDLEF